MDDHKFFLCEHCKNLIGMIHNSGVPIFCCGEPMKLLEANTESDAKEKHLPIVKLIATRLSSRWAGHFIQRLKIIPFGGFTCKPKKADSEKGYYRMNCRAQFLLSKRINRSPPSLTATFMAFGKQNYSRILKQERNLRCQ